ncbi:MAG: zinc-ribbon domain-containing protein, partial [Acetatifactor sp.]
MKCPNCGAKMPENSLYCEHCGEDIHIVPDFEPELELNIE